MADTFVLNSFDLGLVGGSLHDLVGANGAEKNTVIKPLSGDARPSRARIRVGDEDVVLPSPCDASYMGIGVVDQEPNRSCGPTSPQW